MKNVDINLGWACNNRCLFCSNGAATTRQRRWGRLPEIEAEIVRRREEGYQAVGFLGGEPTLYRHLPRIAELARGLGYRRVSICTNGSRLADADRLARILHAGVNRVALSLHSHTAGIEDGITGRKGSHAEKVNALRNLVAARDQGRLPEGLSLNTVLHRKNVEHLVAFAKFIVDLGVLDVRFNFIRPAFEAERSRAWVPAFKVTTPRVLELVAANETRFKINMNFADFPLCALPWELLAQPRLRTRYVGENWDLATDVTQHRPSEDPTCVTTRFNWREERVANLKAFLDGCEACALRPRCEGVWQGYLDIYGPAELVGGPAVAEICLATA